MEIPNSLGSDVGPHPRVVGNLYVILYWMCQREHAFRRCSSANGGSDTTQGNVF